jgi:hypothetical protein
MLPLLARLESVTPEDFPPAPWVLKTNSDTPSGRTEPVVTVTDTEGWLEKLRMDASQGPSGPRGRHGALQSDLQDLELVMWRKAAAQGRLFLCTAEGCGKIMERDIKPENCQCGAELGESAGWEAERWVGVEGPHTKAMSNKTKRFGF